MRRRDSLLFFLEAELFDLDSLLDKLQLLENGFCGRDEKPWDVLKGYTLRVITDPSNVSYPVAERQSRAIRYDAGDFAH